MAPARNIVHLTILVRRGSGLAKPAAVGIAITFSLLAITAVAITTYAYINKWRLPIFQRLADRFRIRSQRALNTRRSRSTRHSQRLESAVDVKPVVGTEERPASKPAKYWSAEDVSRSKVGSVRAPSVQAFPTNSDVFSPAPTPSTRRYAASGYAQSIFSSKTKVSAFMSADGTPQIVRPGSKRVKTGSRHISMQFSSDETGVDLDAKEGRNLSLKEASDHTMKDLEDAMKPEKRNSRAVVTNLDWMDYEVVVAF